MMRSQTGTTLTILLALSGIWTPASHAQTIAGPVVTPLRSYRDLLRAPARLAIDGANRLYVTDSGAGRVLVRDQYGRLVRTSPAVGRPLGIAVDAAGFIYVGDESTGAVTIFTQDWAPIGRLGRGDGEFALPNHIAIDTAGAIYVADSGANVVKKYSPSGQMLMTVGSPGTWDGQFAFPTGVWIAPSGELFVADQDNVRVQVFGADGRFLRKIRLTSGMLGTGGGRIQGITIDSLGRVYVADAFQDVVRVLASDGTKLSTIGAFGSGPGELLNPSSVAIDRHNRLFVASVGNARVDVFGLDAFTDPHLLPADCSLRPAALVRTPSDGKGSPQVTGFVKVPGYSAMKIVRASVKVNGIAASSPPGTAIGDFDDDGLLELRFRVDRSALLETLTDGIADVTVSGLLENGMEFEGVTSVRVESAGGVR